MVSLVRRLVTGLFFNGLALFWGSWLFASLITKFIRSPRKFLACKNYDRLPTVAFDASLGQHSHLRIVSPIDGKLSMKIKYVAKGTKGNPLLLMIHGFPECWYSWRYQLKGMQLKNHWMVAIDLPGYGDSDKPKGKDHYHIDALQGYIAAIIRGLGYEKAVVCGHDWGGAITWRFACSYPQMCEKVILLNAPHGKAWSKVVMSNFKQFLSSWYMFAFQIPYLAEMMLAADDMEWLNMIQKPAMKKGLCSEEDLNVYKYSLYPWAARNAAINYYRCILYGSKLPAKDKVEAPLLLIWGTDDIALTTDLAIASKKYCENGRLEFIEGASHFVLIDAHEKVSELITNFLT